MDYSLSLGMEKNECKGGICSESFLIKNDLSCVIGKKTVLKWIHVIQLKSFTLKLTQVINMLFLTLVSTHCAINRLWECSALSDIICYCQMTPKSRNWYSRKCISASLRGELTIRFREPGEGITGSKIAWEYMGIHAVGCYRYCCCFLSMYRLPDKNGNKPFLAFT